MVVNRLDVYSAVHKMQRARLFELTVDAGKADPADDQEARRLAGAVDAVVAELRVHAEHESRFIHPLLRERAPQVAASLDAEHEELDGRLAELSAVAHASDELNALYRALASFTAHYLEHLAEEESDGLRALWGSCSDEELMGILVSFKSSRSDLENLTSVLAQLPTLNPLERARMAGAALGEGRASEVGELLSTLLDPEQRGMVDLVSA
jgi:Hemerythrin HHE cation binding domain